MAKPELRNHRKFRKLRRLLPEPVPHLIGYLDCLWFQGYQTGDPCIGDETDVEAAAEYPGEAGRFTRAAHEAGFLDRDADGTYRIHDLYEHAPRYVRLRMDRKGFGPAPDGAANGAHNGRTTGAHCAPGGAQDVPPPKPKAEAEAETKAESREPKPKPNPGEAEAGGGDGGPDVWGTGPIRFDPAGGSWLGVTDQQRAVWAKAYPAVDLDADLARAAAWCVANPREGRRSNYGRFLANWFRRTQDSGGSRGRSPPARASPDFRESVANETEEFLRRTGGAM